MGVEADAAHVQGTDIVKHLARGDAADAEVNGVPFHVLAVARDLMARYGHAASLRIGVVNTQRGLEAHAWHGVIVEPWVIREPERITVASIDAERNAEVRRVLVERFGEERLIREGAPELVDSDVVGRLWRRTRAGAVGALSRRPS